MTSALLVIVVFPFASGIPIDFEALFGGARYYIDNAWVLVGIVLQFTSLSLSLALTYFSFFQYPGTRSVNAESAWVSAFGRISERLSVSARAEVLVQVKVVLKQGGGWIGVCDSYSTDRDLDVREIILAPPISEFLESGGVKPVDPGWQRLIVAGRDISAIQVRYISAGDPPMGVERSLSQRARSGQLFKAVAARPLYCLVLTALVLSSPFLIAGIREFSG